MSIVVNPDSIRALGPAAERADNFRLVVNSRFREQFAIGASESYRSSAVVTFDGERPFVELFGSEIPDSTDILTALPDCLLHSVPREALARRRLLIMACRSGPTSLEAIQHFLAAGEASSPEEQERTGNVFFERCQGSRQLTLLNSAHGTQAEFQHLRDHYEWHEQYGTLDWGAQQVFPSGEIACFIVPLYVEQLSMDVRLSLTGQMLLKGPVIVQSGPPSFLEADQERIYQALARGSADGVRLDIREGEVVDVAGETPAARAAAEMLSALMTTDSRYRRLYEIGFSLNPHAAPWPGNCAMNEICGGPVGCIHLGLGMLPHTQYHLDLFCAGTEVRTDAGEWVFGGSGGMKRAQSAACPCLML